MGGGYLNEPFYGVQGVIKREIDYVDSVRFAAQISPKKVKEIKVKEPEDNQLNITKPTIKAPEDPEVKIDDKPIAKVEEPKKKLPIVKEVNISSPKEVSKIGDISVDPIGKVTVAKPDTTSDNGILFPTPDPIDLQLPKIDYKPTFVVIPVIPKIVDKEIEEISTPVATNGGNNPDPDKYCWSEGNGGMMSQIILKKGEFNIDENNSMTVKGYDATLYSPSDPVKGDKPKDGYHHMSSSDAFYTLLNVPYSYFGKDVVINYNNTKDKRFVINLETQGVVAGKLDDYVTAKNDYDPITEDKKDTLKSYQRYSEITGSDNGSTELLFINKGKIHLNSDSSSYLYVTAQSDGNNRTNYIDNEGEIYANGKGAVILNHTKDVGGDGYGWIYSNSKGGKMIANGEGSTLYQAVRNLDTGKVAFINEGTAELLGKKSIGIFYASEGGELKSGYNIWIKNPIKIQAESAMGFLIKNRGIGAGNDKNLFKADIEEGSKKSIGIVQDVNSTYPKTASVITIKGVDNKGIYVKQGTLNIVKPHKDSGETISSIDIKDGEENTGIIATNGTVNFNGNISIEKGKSQTLLASNTGGKITVIGNVTIKPETSDSKALISKGEGAKIELNEDCKKDIQLTGESYGAFASNNGEISIKNSELNNDKPDISIINQENIVKGIGILADTNGKISAEKINLNVQNGSLGIGSSNGSNIDFKNSKLTYSGRGYAIYADSTSKVDISGTKLELSGESVAFDIDAKADTQNILLDDKTRIVPNSEKVTLFNLKNIDSLDTRGGIQDYIVKEIEKKINKEGTQVNLDNLIEKKGKKYKVAAIDGGNLTIGSLDKSGTSSDDINGTPTTDEKKAKKDGYQLYNLLQAQRLKATTVSGSLIKAELSSSQAKNFNNQVVGFEMNSSRNAKDNSDAQINLVNTEVRAKRTDSGKGAIGLYINYGKVNIDNASKVNVEDKTSSNENAVGVFAVNGSEVENNGEITVGGNDSVGIYSTTYREENDKAIKDEFGEKTTPYAFNISNKNKITMEGEKSIGIYARNNKSDDEKSSNTVENVGEITLNGESSTGMYVTKGLIKGKGQINLKNSSVGIYADESNIEQDLGTIKFSGMSNTGVYAKNTSLGEKDSKVNVEITSNNEEPGNIGAIFDSAKSITTKLSVTATGNSIIGYSSNNDITIDADAKITGDKAKGIKVDEGKKITFKKSLEISGENAVGISGDNVTLEGTINVKNKAIGIDGKDVNVENKITLDTENTIGVRSYAGTVNVGENASIEFKNKESKGYFLENSTIKFTNPITFSDNGENKNIYVLANEKSIVNIKDASINTKDNKKGLVGFYLEKESEISGDKLYVSNSAIGIYSGGEGTNKVNVKEVISGDKNTVGIYSEKDTNINNINISSSKSAVGIYGKEGKITFSGDNTLNLSSKGTGIYLEDASLNGGNIKLVNKDTDKKDSLVGVYFKDSKSSVNSSNISIDNDTKLIGLYLDKAIVSNEGKIEATLGSSNNTLAFVANGSTFKNTTNGTLNLTSSDSHAIYVNDGIAENTGNITVDNEGNKPSVAMTGMKTGKKVILTNDGNITVHNNSIGMYLDNGAIGNNKKDIVAQKKDSVGVYVSGNETKFTNTGKISADNIGVYLNKTKEKNITIGNIELTNDNAVAVYANDSKVDFEIKPIVEDGKLPNNLVSLYATGNTEISSKISTANGKNSIGIYLKDKDVSFKDGASVEITKGHEDENGVNYNTGIYADSAYSGDLKVNIENNAKNTIGIAVSKGATVNYSGNIKTGEDSIGVLVKGTFNAKDKTSLDIDGGTGILIDQGTANIGQETTSINLKNSAIAIYQDGGTLNLGENLNVTGSGTLLATKDSTSSIGSKFNVEKDNIGIIASFNKDEEHGLTLTSKGSLNLVGDNAKGIYAKSDNNKAKIVNSGEIAIPKDSKNLKNTIGIYSDNVKVENTGVIKANTGIYITNESNVDNTGKIELVGESSRGILGVGIKNEGILNIGQITGKEKGQKGIYLENNDKKLTLNNANITLNGDSSYGIVIKNDVNKEFSLNNSEIEVANDGVGIYSKKTSGDIKNTNITLNSSKVGLAVEGENTTLNFEGTIKEKENTTGSKLVYAKDNATVKLSVPELIVTKDGLGLGVDNATINTDKETKITVNGGTGAYISNGSISDKFKIDVQNGFGAYISGKVATKWPKVILSGNGAKAYLLNNMEDKVTLGDIKNEGKYSDQIYIYAQGTGKGIDVKNIQINGSNNYGIYNLANQDITAKELNISGSKSFGIYSTCTDGTKKINVNKIVTGKNSAGVYSINGNIIQTGEIISQGLGIYSEKGSVTLNGSKISLDNSNGIGVKAKNSNITISNAMTISDGKEGATGIYSEGTGDITFNNNLVVNKDIIGVYKNGKGTINLNGSSIFENGIGVYSKVANVDNKGNIDIAKDAKDAKGIYVENANITSNGTVTINGENAIGLAGKNGEINSTGNISVTGKDAVGIYSDEAKVTSKGNITSNSIGIYSKGSKNITQSGDITVGEDAVGIFKEGSGDVNIFSTNVTVGDKGYGLHYVSNGTVTSNITKMTLGKEAVGMYINTGTLKYNGDIIVGETTIGENGYTDYSKNKNSVGIFANNSKVEYTGNLTIDKPLSVGIFAKGAGSNISVKSGSTLNVKNGAFGIMSDDDLGENGTITIEKGATLNIEGKSKNNPSTGIAAYSGKVVNNGTFNISDGGLGIYYDSKATFENNGTVNVNGGTFSKSSNSKANIADGMMVINYDGTLKFNIPNNMEFVNKGVLDVNGKVNLDNMVIDLGPNTQIKADQIEGKALISPNFSKGNSVEEYVFKDIFRPKTAGIGKFMGDIKSQSLSWIAKVGKVSENEPTQTKDIIMVRIPYTVLIKGKRHEGLASGLDRIRMNISKDKTSNIFKSLDSITNDDVFASAIANMRGDIYSNIQERMLDVDNTFDKSYKEVLDSHNVTDRVHKFSVIYSKNKHIDETLGVSSYDKDSYGILYLNDRENEANKYGFSVGLICSKFNFTGPTSLGSSEEMRSGKFGLHYQRTKDNLKYLTRLELGVNKHITNRVSNVNGMKYKYNANYWSYNIDWKNRLSYDIDVTKDFRITPYANLDVTYGKIFGINEDALTDPTLKLSVKPNSYFVITPRIGIDAKYDIELKNDMHISLKGNLEYHYDLNELYKRVNMARFSSVKDYYDLSIPGYRRSGLKVGGEVEIGKKDRYGVTFGATYDRAMKYSLRFNYKF
ncbi:autotransporter domain-containing protein [uncultured Sneathia sp.]|uniref:autotransporter domain-containing protein n=1 Tax=uncultured Sneathia sp. TaxID=278067 RepID=UPI0025977500|nr:autotransporter domain-containing protein [uncultured Sneathia sp.]